MIYHADIFMLDDTNYFIILYMMCTITGGTGMAS